MVIEGSVQTEPSLTTATDMPMAMPSSTKTPITATTTATTDSSEIVLDSPQQSITALAPGFRFHPTDEELVICYLKHKIYGKSFPFNVISSLEIYKFEPWELPAKALIETRDQEWYFFSTLDKKYVNGTRKHRGTDKGYWKATGRNRAVKHNNRVVGLKRFLVFHYGRRPNGKRTNWVIHEYRLAEEEMNKCGAGKIPYVLCKVFHKSSTSPPVENQHALVVEEKWHGEDTILPVEVVSEEVTTIETSDIEKELPSSEVDVVLHAEPPTETRDVSPTLDSTPPMLQNKRRKMIDLNSTP